MSSMRSIGTNVLSFGLITIPMKTYITASEDKVSFHWLSPAGNRISQKKIDSVSGEEVEQENIQHGYAIDKNNCIAFTTDELEAIRGDKKNVIEVSDIVPMPNIRPEHIEKSLFLAPDKSDKSYRLFHKCLLTANKVAVCKWFARGKDNLVIVAPHDENILIMHQLFYQNELRELATNFAKGSEPSESEVKLGMQLLKKMSSGNAFDLSLYKDEYILRVEEAVKAKTNHEAPVIADAKPAFVMNDLAALLEKSLAEEKELPENGVSVRNGKLRLKA